MKHTELQQIITACLTLQPIMWPSAARIADVDAEAELLAAAWLEEIYPAEPVPHADYYATLHRALAEVLAAARAKEINPTVELVVKALGPMGIRGPHLENAVARILESDPVAVNVERAAYRVRSCAWRRRMVLEIDCLRALIVEPQFADEAVEAQIDSLVEVASRGPEKGSP